MIPARRCPVCWQPVWPTRVSQQVQVHLDSQDRHKCPMTGHNFWLCYPMANDPKLRGAA